MKSDSIEANRSEPNLGESSDDNDLSLVPGMKSCFQPDTTGILDEVIYITDVNQVRKSIADGEGGSVYKSYCSDDRC
jgi:hypothetical protein